VNLVWKHFDLEWYRFFKKRTKRAFVHSYVSGQCAYVADLYRQYLGRGQNQYGFYMGEITHPNWNQPPVRHGWLRLKKSIVDPTRWCFMADETPLLAETDLDNPDYDVGMRRFKADLFGDWHANMPEYDENDAHECDQPDLVLLFGGKISLKRLFWIANQPPESKAFVDEAERGRVFRWLQSKKNLSGLVPIDNRV
jgi:hypothetical protein